ncbi:hypothetical protein R84981_001727 [Carnimonas sp. R-84981]|uniref:hypothetical protein n=1 Tax=Carnimonas bestiolae TaxID=3402172 RepID=UPI003EDB80E4
MDSKFVADNWIDPCEMMECEGFEELAALMEASEVNHLAYMASEDGKPQGAMFVVRGPNAEHFMNAFEALMEKKQEQAA